MASVECVCPSCGERLDAGTTGKAAKRVRCESCGKRVRPRRVRDAAKPKGKSTVVLGTPRDVSTLPDEPDEAGSAAPKTTPPSDDSGYIDEAIIRSARLPPVPSGPPSVPSTGPARRSSAKPITEGIDRGSSKPPRRQTPEHPSGGSSRWTLHRLTRESILDVTGRTTVFELARMSTTILAATQSRVPPRFGVKLALSSAFGAALVLIVTAALAIGNWRWVPIGLIFVALTGLLAVGALRALPRVARRFGAWVLPGPAAAWLSAGLAIIGASSAGLTWATTEVTMRVGRAVVPVVAQYVPLPFIEPAATAMAETSPPVPVKQPWASHVWVHPGRLFMPPGFAIRDGKFDLILFSHGNPDVVREAVIASGVNALVHVTNLGTGSILYQTHFSNPQAFDALLREIEVKCSEKVGSPVKVGRVALASWSAGYGSTLSILNHKSLFDRIDAVLVLDGIHTGYMPATHDVDPNGVAPFIKFAAEAIAGRKLMIITHSAIVPPGYASTTETANAILAANKIERKDVDASTSPPPVKLEAALAAFPINGRRWLKARNAAHAGNLHVYAYTGVTAEDHIAHLAQMSVTILPPLVERWRTTVIAPASAAPPGSAAPSAAPSASAAPASSAPP
jgi:hypothetical protein